ncbi:class I SAM-dependent methyltransferase [Patescibacteria group bacterium]|nr:class I SAM-dependent methyltransferase [Patescibacteria group bacterium]MBU1075064.1 class I SAM-dependent methyltransferase [Patescibacteria group bacterium]MBU1951282.1 class I SAM-dependent methyltransferase [Patescibacteria group bacterium]MBU2228777.1 class I SAM-dependent methyltransferase [Patescibacteria group bacterium]
MLEEFLYLLAIFFILIVFGTMAVAGFRGAPWVPTKKKDLDRLIKLADIQEGDTIYELGSGDGRILFEIAKRYRVDAIGVEISLLPYLYSKTKLWLMNTIFVQKMKGKVSIVYRDMFQQKLESADIVICFLLPKVIRELEKKFSKELKKNAKVVSYVFPLELHNALAVDKPEKSNISIFLYRF